MVSTQASGVAFMVSDFKICYCISRSRMHIGVGDGGGKKMEDCRKFNHFLSLFCLRKSHSLLKGLADSSVFAVQDIPQ